ncbi:MAG: YraN family protein [Patescibacteria group bacterium]|nr:YraN family protein [Patescibacteria group bacterium]
MSSKQVGEIGEDVACKYLRGKGYRILERNYKEKIRNGFCLAEIDIIVEKKDIISFVEVKASEKYKNNKNLDEIAPEQRVDIKKQRKIAKLAEIWLNKNKIPLDSMWQIDVVSVIVDFETRKAKVSYFENVAEWLS